jgi:hypothetical protein
MTWQPFASWLRPRRADTTRRTGWVGIDRAKLGLPKLAQPGPDLPYDQAAALHARVAELEQRTQRDAFLLLRVEASRAAAQKQVETLTAELAAEQAEAQRLVDEGVRLRRVHADALAAARLETCQCGGDDTHWRRRSEQDRANALRMADQLAAAERRPIGSGYTP